jgi:hypothetical protein
LGLLGRGLLRLRLRSALPARLRELSRGWGVAKEGPFLVAHRRRNSTAGRQNLLAIAGRFRRLDQLEPVAGGVATEAPVGETRERRPVVYLDACDEQRGAQARQVIDREPPADSVGVPSSAASHN